MIPLIPALGVIYHKPASRFRTRQRLFRLCGHSRLHAWALAIR